MAENIPNQTPVEPANSTPADPAAVTPAAPPAAPTPAVQPPAYPAFPAAQPEVPAPKKRPKILLIGAVLLVVLAVIAAIVAVQAQQAKSSKKAVSCTSESCFTQRFSSCQPAAYTFNDAGGSVHYTILGKRDIGCDVTVKYLKGTYYSGVNGKSMTCNMDNSKSFKTAAKYAVQYPDDYDCSGDLATFFKDNPSPNTDN